MRSTASEPRWLVPRDRLLRGVSWPLGGATGERRRCWTPRCRSPVAKRTPGARPLCGLRPGGSGPDAPDRASGRARSWHQPSRSRVEARELVVDEALELRVEALLVLSRGRTAPAPRADQ